MIGRIWEPLIGETANQVFEGIAWTDAIDIFSDSETGNVNDSKKVNMDSVQQKQRSHTFNIC